MSLFPAYAQALEHEQDEQLSSGSEGRDAGEEALSPGAESRLLAEPAPAPAPAPPPAPAARAAPFFVDRALDRGNLRVSTLYFPARPQYRARDDAALGVARGRAAGAAGPARARRYWRRGAAVPADDAAAAADEVARRRAAFRQALDDDPKDELLWMRYIDFLEWCGGGAADAAEAARAAVRARPRSAALHSRLHAALRRALPPAALAPALRDLREHEHDGAVRAELRGRELSALAAAGELGAARGTAAERDARAAAHHDTVLLAHGCVLRCAGLWEELVQLVELVTAMNLGGAGPFPPPAEPARTAAAERELAAWEARAAAAGLPRATVWARVERARAALHWRPPAPGAASPLELAADPQRAPDRAAAADLLLPPAGPRAAFRLLLALLRLAETPLLPAAEYAARGAAGSAGAAELAADWEAAAGLTLVALVRAARRLPPAHPARRTLTPGAARRLLALTPLRAPGMSAAEPGFCSWRAALWEAALAHSSGPRRAALLCWRLRDLHARLLLADNDEDVRAARSAARGCLRRWAGGEALPFAVFARLEAAAAGPAAGRRAARAALRQALRGPDPPEAALYAARVVHELCCEEGAGGGGGGAADGEGRWALCCAVLRAPLPPDDELLAAPPPAGVLRAARDEVERRCLELERQFQADEEEGGGAGDEEAGEGALLPAAGEWGAARALLAPPHEHARLLHQLLAAGARGTAAAARYAEQCACALTAAARRAHAAQRTARAALHLAPLNAYLALMSGGAGAGVWQAAVAGAGAGGDRAAGLGAPRCELAAWAALLAPLLAAAGEDTHEGWAAVERGVSRAARAAGAAGGPLLAALRLHAAPPAPAALVRALAAAPHCKWVYVEGAARGGGGGEADAAALAELVLERGLRLHALPQELDLAGGAGGGAAAAADDDEQ